MDEPEDKKCIIEGIIATRMKGEEVDEEGRMALILNTSSYKCGGAFYYGNFMKVLCSYFIT